MIAKLNKDTFKGSNQSKFRFTGRIISRARCCLDKILHGSFFSMLNGLMMGVLDGLFFYQEGSFNKPIKEFQHHVGC